MNLQDLAIRSCQLAGYPTAHLVLGAQNAIAVFEDFRQDHLQVVVAKTMSGKSGSQRALAHASPYLMGVEKTGVVHITAKSSDSLLSQTIKGFTRGGFNQVAQTAGRDAALVNATDTVHLVCMMLSGGAHRSPAKSRLADALRYLKSHGAEKFLIIIDEAHVGGKEKSQLDRFRKDLQACALIEKFPVVAYSATPSTLMSGLHNLPVTFTALTAPPGYQGAREIIDTRLFLTTEDAVLDDILGFLRRKKPKFIYVRLPTKWEQLWEDIVTSATSRGCRALLFASGGEGGALPIEGLIGTLEAGCAKTTVVGIKASLSAGDDLINKDTGRDARNNILAAFELRFAALDTVDQTMGRHTGTHTHTYPIYAYDRTIRAWTQHTEAIEEWYETHDLTVFDSRRNNLTYRPAEWKPKVAKDYPDYLKKMQKIVDANGSTRKPIIRSSSEAWIAFAKKTLRYEAQAFVRYDPEEKLSKKGEEARTLVAATYGLVPGSGLYFDNLVAEKPMKSTLTVAQAI